MIKLILISIVIIGISIAFLAIRILCGKKNFVSSDVDDNPALRKKGIICPQKQDREIKQHDGFTIKEHS